MSVPAMRGRRLGWLVVGSAVGIAVVLALIILARQLQLPGRAASAARSAAPAPAAAKKPPPAPSAQNASVWGPNVNVAVPFQQTIEQLPEGAPYMLRVTELEMEPGARIFEHRQLSVGAHVVVRGSITIENLDAGQTATYRVGQAYFEGLGSLHRAVNLGPEANRVLMVDLLSASRGWDGTQQFTSPGRHNEGGLRSGPFVQVPLAELPAEPLMLRVSEISLGPKAKTVEHTRLGPAVFFVEEGTATIRKNWANSSMTHGTNGYFFEAGREPFILENKPAAPARVLAVELLPASLGDGPSTIPTGNPEPEPSD